MKRNYILVGFLTWVMFDCISVSANTDLSEPIPSHISTVIESDKGNLTIDADVDPIPDRLYTGNLKLTGIEENKGSLLYGESGLWKKEDFLVDADYSYIYSNDTQIFYSGVGSVFYYENNLPGEQLIEKGSLTEEEALEKARKLLELLEIKGIISGRFAEDTDPENVYSYMIKGLIDDVPIAFYSDNGIGKGSIEITGKEYTYCYYTGDVQIEEKTAVTMMSVDDIMKQVENYMQAGFLSPKETQKIVRISLEYYVEQIGTQLTFIPVWNFQTDNMLGDGTIWQQGEKEDDLFYLGVEDGILLKSCFYGGE